MSNFSKHDIDYLLTPEAIRNSTQKIFNLCEEGGTNFKLNLDKLAPCSDYVLDVIKENYPSLDIPFHSRWGHFQVGSVDRETKLNGLIETRDPMERARTKLDLAIVSVLLDAGAGKEWKYKEAGTFFSRSEGLAVASFHMFLDGHFSSSKDNQFQADAQGLMAFNSESLRSGFQICDDNPLIGVEGRVELLNKLGETVSKNKEFFPKGRPGSIIDYLCAKHGKNFTVKDILSAILLGLGPIWPGRISAKGVNLGDVWHYPAFGEEINVDSVVCFHKLSQWLTYSLVVPMINAGLIIDGAEKLTGLAEYRNGGLFLDFGVIELRNKEHMGTKHKPSSDLIIEWRALTVQLLDRIGAMIQESLDKKPEDFPLAKVLEGGTWWAGRKIAKEKRTEGTSPLILDSDGTVF